jgi:hypothetical protein
LAEATGFKYHQQLILPYHPHRGFGLGYGYRHTYLPILFLSKDGSSVTNRQNIGNILPTGKLKSYVFEKPLETIKLLISQSSKPSELVFDPTIGSGTTAVAAKLLGRHYLGFEIDPAIYTKATKRINSTVSLDTFQIDSVNKFDRDFIDRGSNADDFRKKRGRPSLKSLKIDFNKVKADYEKLKSLRKVARLHGISRTSVMKIIKCL